MSVAEANQPSEASSALTRRWVRERSARLEAEAIAERSLRDLYEQKEQLELLRTIVIAANESSSVEDVLSLSLAHICEKTGWPLGHVYLVESVGSRERLIPTTIWYGAERESSKAFQDATRDLIFHSGVGLLGRVLATGKPHWIPDLSLDTSFTRGTAAKAANIVAGCALPVLLKREVVAVLEFFSHERTEPKSFFLQLMAEIGTQLGRVVERRRSEEQLIYDASHDPLTKLPNRAFFLSKLARAIERTKLDSILQFAVFFIDLDRIKVINDSLGHYAGDALITEVGKRLLTIVEDRSLIRSLGALTSQPTLARFGGDEFTFLFEDVRDSETAQNVADHIQQILANPFSVAGREIHITASIGIVCSGEGCTSADELLRDADIAMYRAKAGGRARYEVFDRSMYAEAYSRLEMETSLRKAVTNDELILHYQPILSLDSLNIVGFEALIRWAKPGPEIIYPDRFIGIAEDTGLIVSIGLWVLWKACRTMVEWNSRYEGETPLNISVNVSARQITEVDFVKEVGRVIRETGIDPKLVCLEITESVTMRDAEQSVNILKELRSLGLLISIDDFGTGYSSLSYLHRFPMQTLKIDRSFVSRIDQDAESFALVKTIVAMATCLGLKVVAEGVETASHVAELVSLGCEFAQGYFFFKPLTENSVATLLEARSKATEHCETEGQESWLHRGGHFVCGKSEPSTEQRSEAVIRLGAFV